MFSFALAVDSLDTVANTGNNYLNIAAKMANQLLGVLQGAMDKVSNTGVLMKVALGFLAVTLGYHLVTAILRGVMDGNPRGLVGEIFDSMWAHVPRIVIFTVASFAAIGVTSLATWGSANLRANSDNVFVKAADPFAKQATELLGNETGINGTLSPLGSIRAGTKAAIIGIDKLNALEVRNKITSKVQEMMADSKVTTVRPAQMNSGTDKILRDALDKIIVTVVKPLFDFGVMASFVASQYVLAKNLVVNYIYMWLAWKMALHFLPLMVLLAYWRSLQGFLVSGLKHLVALAIAGEIIGQLAQALFQPQFWLGTRGATGLPVVGMSDYALTKPGTGILGHALDNRVISTTGSLSEVGTYLWFKEMALPSMILIQFATLFALVGVILGEIFTVVRSAMDGAMRSSYQASITSTFGK